MPSGQRTADSGRRAMPRSATSATACQYSANSRLVIPGQSWRSALVSSTPPTVVVARLGGRATTIRAAPSDTGTAGTGGAAIRLRRGGTAPFQPLVPRVLLAV